MGTIFSGLTREDIREVKRRSKFAEKEVRRYYRRFRDLDKEEMGLVYLETLLCIPELSINPLGPRVVRVIREREGEELDFKKFLRVLEIYTKHSTPEDKMRYAFRVLDMGEEGRLGLVELEELGRLIYADSSTEQEIQQLALDTLKTYDRGRKGHIDYEDFKAAAADIDFSGIMTIL